MDKSLGNGLGVGSGIGLRNGSGNGSGSGNGLFLRQIYSLFISASKYFSHRPAL